MTRVLGLPRRAEILEIGCGSGCGLAALGRTLAPRRLVGIDIDRGAVVAAHDAIEDARSHVDPVTRKGFGRAEVYEADVRAMPFDDAAFDLVFDFGTLWHIARPEAALAEIARVLRWGGYFIHETKLNQLASHPIRSFARHVRWNSEPSLVAHGSTLLWGVRRKLAA